MKAEFFLKNGWTNDFLYNIAELLLDLENDFGSPEELEAKAKYLFELAEHATETDRQQITRLTTFFADIRQLLRANEKEYLDYKYELRTYTDGRLYYDEANDELHYFDHPHHQEYFKNLNINQWKNTGTAKK